MVTKSKIRKASRSQGIVLFEFLLEKAFDANINFVSIAKTSIECPELALNLVVNCFGILLQ